jgi:hypothetical protein
MFLGVNLSEGKYQSINKVEVKQENNGLAVDTATINWTKAKREHHPES